MIAGLTLGLALNLGDVTIEKRFNDWYCTNHYPITCGVWELAS